MRRLAIAAMACGSLGCGNASRSSNAPAPARDASVPVSFPQTCEAIARDLETLVPRYAQLADYRAADQTDCHISYEYKTLPPSGRGGGWSAGVPSPETDGVFLYIGIWDPNAQNNRQLDMQPAMGNWVIGNRRVTFILLEGDHTTSAAADVRRILERHGMRGP